MSATAQLAVLEPVAATRATPAAPGAHGLTAEQLASYIRDGYVVVRGMYSPERIAALAAECEGLHEQMAAHAPDTVNVSWEELAPGKPPRIRQLMNSEMVSPILDAMSRSPEMLEVMKQLIGPDLYLFHSKLMMKAAHDGTFTPWHQDWGYWQHHSNKPTQVNCMLAIDPADAENGAIRFVAGTQNDGPVTHKDFQSSSFNIGLDGDLDAYPHAVLIDMAPGDAVFFGPLVIHGSGPNRSARDRRANTFAYDRAGNAPREELPAHHHRAGRS
jgi:ectoine hydroxylase-related dioxygenase (phytanoyl-CoA dioxygenase family)